MTQIQLPKIRRKVLGDQLEARLVVLPGPPAVSVHRGEIRAPLPLLQTNGQDDPSGRVAPYVVLFDGTGPTEIEAGLARCGEQLRWGPQVTVAAGTSLDCIQTVDRVMAWLQDWRPVLEGVSTGFLLLPPGYDPGPPRQDPTVKPIRFFVPLQFRLDATT